MTSESPVYKITTDGEEVPMPDKHPTLEELQEAVGGWIETVRVDATTLMVVDEEGLLKQGLSQNLKASRMTGRYIKGDVVIMPASYLD